MSVDIHLNRADRIYRPNERVAGTIVVKTDSGFAHSGIILKMDGVVELTLSAKAVGLFDAFYNSLKPIPVCDVQINLQQSGNLKTGVNEFEFELDLKPLEGQDILYETYHGVYVNVTYTLRVEIVRKFFGKNLIKTLEFIVEQNPGEDFKPVPEKFILNSDSVETTKSKMKNVPQFSIVGEFESTEIRVQDPLWGFFTIENCSEPIRAVEIQLVRVETVGSTEGYSKEATEIQNIQIADGDVPRGLPIPMHMVFPRLFSCPTTTARAFKIEFEMNFVLMFPDGRLVTKKFPITLKR